MRKIVEDSRRFVAVVVAAVFAAAILVGTAAATVADTPAVFAATVATVVDTATVADTAVVVVAVVANHSKNHKIAQKSDRETHNLHDWFRTNRYAC